MRNHKTRLTNPSQHLPLWLLAAAIGLCSAAAKAQDNTATGNGALISNTSGYQNTADGYWALHFNTTGYANTAVGGLSLRDNTTGFDNTATGAAALRSNTTGTSNTANGHGALGGNTTGYDNTAIGKGALSVSATGHDNTATGAAALLNNTTGYQNTANGNDTLNYNTTGKTNTALGYQALAYNEAGSNNVGVGAGALLVIEGNNNIGLGTNAGKLTHAGSNNIYVGHNGINGNESKVTRIGQTQIKAFIAGVANVAGSGKTVAIKPDGQLVTVSSSARYKHDIQPLAQPGDVADKLARLRPVSFRYTEDAEATHYGLIAEEVDTVMPELVIRDGDKRADSVQYVELIPLLLQQWKVQQAEIARQRALIERQEATLNELRRTLATRFAAREETRRE
jgi:hypothetical protein